MRIASIICIIVWTISVTLYLYIDNYVTIPQSWYEQIRSLCPKIRKTDLLHSSSVAYAGYSAILPFIFFWNATKCSEQGQKWYPKISHLDFKIGFLEIVMRLIAVVMFDDLSSQ